MASNKRTENCLWVVYIQIPHRSLGTVAVCARNSEIALDIVKRRYARDIERIYKVQYDELKIECLRVHSNAAAFNL